MIGASTANGAIVTSRYSATLPRWASVVAAKNRVPARETAIIASPAMCRALTHRSWVRPLSPAPSARLAARTRSAAAAVSCRERATATRATVTFGGTTPGSGGTCPAPGGSCRRNLPRRAATGAAGGP